MASVEDQQELVGNERALFDNVSRAYDNNDWNRGIKFADQILSVKPENGETLSMKALCIHHQLVEGPRGAPKKDHGYTIEDAYTMAKLGLRYNMKSPISWHVLAMMHKSDGQWGEALKCYRQSHNRDKNNINILRDMSSVAAQQRDWEVFLECRQKMLAAKTPVRAHWIGVAAGHYMLKNYEIASAILDVMCTIMEPGEAPAEKNEVILFRAHTALLANNPQLALKILEENEKIILDADLKLLTRAEALTKLNEKKKAEACYIELATQGIEEERCIRGLAELRGVHLDHRGLPLNRKDSHRDGLLKIIADVLKANPKSDFAKRLRLDVCPVAAFKDYLIDYTTPFVQKNIPSLFSVLKSIYTFGQAPGSDADEKKKIEILEETFLQFESEVKAAADGKTRFGESNPTVILWIWTFLATHYSRIGNHTKAHEFIDKAIKHTPTIEMLYLHRAKIYRREGKLAEAVKDAEMARTLDLQDKYLNSKSAKYMLRAGMIEEAEKTLGIFFKPSEVNDHYLQLFDSQTLWFERELGNAFLNAKNDPYQALQVFLLYDVHRRDDQKGVMDFHQYCIRNGRLRAWTEVLNRDPLSADDKFFLAICAPIVRAYLTVNEWGPEKTKAAFVPRPELPATKEADDNATRNQRIKDFILDADITEPLEKATRFVEALKTFRPHSAVTHQTAFEYHLAKKQPLGAGKALKAMKPLVTAECYATYVARWTAYQSKDSASWPDAVKAALAKLKL
jgi:tetratricopeptide (TPR) repeat protein